MIKSLINSQLFKGLNEQELEKILNSTHYNMAQFSRGDLLAITGEEVKMIMLIVRGCVRAEMLDSTGKIFRIEDIETPGMIAPGFVFGKHNRFPVNVVANCETEILAFPKDSFITILDDYPEVMVNYLNILSDKTQYLSFKIKNVFLQPIQGKIANFLISKSKETGSLEFDMGKSQTWLAERFSVARPSVARVFSDMKSKGILDVKGKNVKILEIGKLKECVTVV